MNTYLDKISHNSLIITTSDKKIFEFKISSEDINRVKAFTWHISKSGRNYYARGRLPRNKSSSPYIYLHRLIMSFPENGVDHKNGDTLDNTRGNLREANKSQNGSNSRNRLLGSCKYRGITFSYGKYVAQITIDKSHKRIGTFETPEEAAMAYDAKAIELFGEFAVTNF